MTFLVKKGDFGDSARMKISAPGATIILFWSKVALGAIMNKLSAHCGQKGGKYR